MTVQQMDAIEQAVKNSWDVYQTCAHAEARAKRWLDDRLRRARNEYFAEKIELTPEMAKQLLERNPSNRTISLDVCRKYARDILAGRWALNGETIVVSDDGFLNDGQHRCGAVVIAQRSIHTMIAFGVSRESRTTVDAGKARTVGDYLGMDGVRNANHVAAIAGIVLDIKKNGRVSSGLDQKPTKSEIYEFAATDDDVAKSVSPFQCTKARKIAPISTLGAAYYFIAQANAVLAEDFFHHLIEGAEMKAKNPIMVCREKLLARDLRLNTNERLKTILSAWNNWREGREVRTIVHVMKRGDKLPEPRR